MAISRHAVVIGVNKYEDETIPELKGAENDATELHQRLIDQASGGFGIADGHFLVGKQATCDAIRQAVSDLLWKTDSSDLSLFYFSGHGFHDEYGDGYIAPWNMRRDEPMVRGIRMRELTDRLLAAKMKKTVLMILDCCYSGIAAEGKGGMRLSTEKPRFDDWFSALGEDTGKGRIVLASAGKDEKSHELTRPHTLARGGEVPHPHGVFTYHLLEALDGKAASGDDDQITLDGLLKYIEAQTKDDSEHKPTVFGASMTQAGTIRIARANQWRNIRDSLQEVKDFLASGEPFGTFAAAQRLGAILTNFATLPEAKDLKQAVDAKLSAYQGPAVLWLMDNRYKMGKHFGLLDRLRPTAAGLSVDVIINLMPEPRFISLLEALVSVSCLGPTGQAFRSKEDFLVDLIGYANAQARPADIAKPETPGQGNVS